MSLFKKIMIALGVLVAIIIVIIGIAFYATSGLMVPIRGQLDALKANDVTKAYSYTSKDFQSATSLDEFQKFVDHYPSLKNNESSSFTSREINNDIGTVRGALHSKDGATTPIEYRLVKESGEWKILEITVNPTGISTTNEKSVNNKPSGALIKVFDEKDSHYTINYPEDWEYDTSSKGTVIFSGKRGTPAYYSTVNIQTVLTKKTGGEYVNVNEFISDIRKQASVESTKAKFLENGPYEIKAKDGSKLSGEYIVFTYRYKDIDFKQWQIVLLRPDGQVFYAWAYTAPIQEYDTNLPIAKAMLQTWSIY